MLRSLDPTTGEPLRTYDALAPDALDARLARAARAFEHHRTTSLADRAAKLRRVADALEANAHRHAETMTREMGKPVGQAEAEAKKCAWVCRYYADRAAAFLADEPRTIDEAHRTFVAYEPLGPVLAVMPWNYPYWQVFRFAAPAVMAGNVGLLKHAENVQGCAEAIETLFLEAGFAEGVFQNLPIELDAVQGVIEDGRVRAVTLTGSERAGRAVASQAGQALKPTVLELGGSDPFLVLADADLDRALDLAVTARMQNNGQSCIAAKRFILERPIADAFTERFVERVEALTLGDPMAPDTDVGPMAREDLRDGLHDQVERAVAQGAALLTGGTVPDRPGFFYPPTVLAGVTEGMVPFEEELFGPVAALSVAEDVDDAVRLANATRFGLSSAVFTEDRAKGEAVARRMHAGGAFVNQMSQSHPNLPFGGIGDSGYGRELARQGIRAFVNEKAIWIE
ncbi:MAG: NAD-dependent succinate-semialdehyde dehydrogenase [Bacteroidota bacterium]